MSVLTVSSGQCGNQLGAALYEKIYGELGGSEGQSPEMDYFFRSGIQNPDKYVPRAVCIDTEPKVIREVVHSPKLGQWKYDPNSAAYRHGGAGNNWSLGYQMCSGEFLEEILDKVRRELEFCDISPAIVNMHSLAGGTGSGLGTGITEEIADIHGHLARLNIVIAPYHFGEVVVQNYNAVLSLSRVSEASHGVLVFENEAAHDLSKHMRGIEQPRIRDLNDTIATSIVPLLLPKVTGTIGEGGEGSSRRRRPAVRLRDDLSHLACHPSYRFLDAKVTPCTPAKSIDFTFDSWPSVLNTLYQMQLTGATTERGLARHFESIKSSGRGQMKTVASVLTLHGTDAEDATLNMAPKSPLCEVPRDWDENGEREGDMPPLYSDTVHPSGESVRVDYSHHRANGYDHSGVLFSNSQAILPVLQRVNTKAIELFKAGAYLHQYEAHGVTKDDFRASFLDVGQVIQDYRAL